MAVLNLDHYIIDTLMPDLVGHDRSASGFLVYLCLWRHTQGRGRATVEVSYQTIASDTGLSKTAVQNAIRGLKRRRLVSAELRHATATPIYRVLRPWLGKASSRMRMCDIMCRAKWRASPWPPISHSTTR